MADKEDEDDADEDDGQVQLALHALPTFRKISREKSNFRLSDNWLISINRECSIDRG